MGALLPPLPFDWNADGGPITPAALDFFNKLRSTVAGLLSESNAPKNLLVDGSFEVWDGLRNGAAFVAATGYTGCTMWSYSAGAGFAGYTANIRLNVGGGASGPFALRYRRNAGGADVVQQALYQDLESVVSAPLQGQNVVLSFDATAGATFSAANGTLVSSIQTGTGTDQAQRAGAYTGSIITSQNNPLTTTKQRFQQFLSVPATANQIGIAFQWTPTGVASGNTDYVQFDNVQLKGAGIATNFELLPVGQIRNLVARHYRKTFPEATAPAQNAGLAGALTFPLIVAGAVLTIGPPVLHGVPMRATPTVTFYNPAAANAFVRNVTLATDATTTAVANAGDMGFGITQTGLAAWAVGNQLAVHFQADARI